MFPPTVFGTVIQEKKKSLRCTNLQCNKEFLGNKAGENELIAIPDKTNRTLIQLYNSFICAFHPTYTDST